MRWKIIRLIWLRELKDQLRDRRTLFMIAVLPVLLYPILGFAVLKFALGFSERPSIVGVVATNETFPRYSTSYVASSPGPRRLAWLAAVPGQPGAVVGALGFAHAAGNYDYPPFLRSGQFTVFDQRPRPEHPHLFVAELKLRLKWLEKVDQKLLDEKAVDLILEAPADFYTRLELAEDLNQLERPALVFHDRPDDDASKQARQRLHTLLAPWKADLKQVRLARKNLPPTFDDPFEVTEIAPKKRSGAPETLFDLMIRIFPFMLVMWSLAGALYPAVDLCAGEKERGTMETLLITPAGREEIVMGKFLTIWVFSAGSALLNLLSMGFTTWQFGGQLLQGNLPLPALLWSVVLSLPLSALFSAVSLAIGAYARSSKEGQYYLMPLFLVTMPLIFLTLAPGVELNPFYSLVPVTGVALLMQRLMTAPTLGQVPWLYFIPVLAPVALYSWLALRWAIVQFHREEVLFREAERLDIKLWLRSLLREKEPTPTTGQAACCFGIILGMTWLAAGLSRESVPLTVQAAIRLLAFVAAPALFMTLLLNTQPRAALFLQWPQWKEVGLAAILALLVIPPLAGLTVLVLDQFPQLTRLLEYGNPIFAELHTFREGGSLTPQLWSVLVFALLPALCEEIAFRGVILTGLQRRFRPRNAVILSSFCFALYHMNVFQFVPAFFLGVILGLLTVRSKSLLPAILFHFLHNTVILSSMHVARGLEGTVPAGVVRILPVAAAACLAVAMALLWWLYRKPYVDEERMWAEYASRERADAANGRR